MTMHDCLSQQCYYLLWCKQRGQWLNHMEINGLGRITPDFTPELHVAMLQDRQLEGMLARFHHARFLTEIRMWDNNICELNANVIQQILDLEIHFMNHDITPIGIAEIHEPSSMLMRIIDKVQQQYFATVILRRMFNRNPYDANKLAENLWGVLDLWKKSGGTGRYLVMNICNSRISACMHEHGMFNYMPWYNTSQIVQNTVAMLDYASKHACAVVSPT